MIKHLYDNFSNWYKGGEIFFYSDPHFNDKEASCFRKDYIGDEEQVKRINSKIGKKDTIIILGDIGDFSFIKKIRGYKILIMGNHDKGASNYKRYSLDENSNIIDNKLFDEVYEGPLVISEKIIISHEPIDGLPFFFNIHGHDHAGRNKNNNHLNVCAELINYTPISFKKIINSGYIGKIKSIHRTVIEGRN